MRALVRKELRQLLPWIVLAVASELLEWLSLVVFSRIDEQHWMLLNADVMPGNHPASSIGCVLLGLVIGTSLFPREYDEGTIHFLRGLPTSAGRIFTSKLLAGALFISGWLVIDAVAAWALQRFNSHSMYGQLFVARTAVIDVMLSVLACLCVMCHAVFLSFFRRFGLLLFALGWIGLEALRASHPEMARFNPTALLEYRYSHGALIVPWAAMRVQALGAGVSLLLGAVVWTVSAERVTDLYARVQQRWWGRMGQRMAPFAIAAAVLGVIAVYNPEAFDDDDDMMETGGAEVTAQLETLNYVFTYPSDARSRMLSLARNADANYAAVATALGVEQPPPIIADLTEYSTEHLGIAAGHKVRISLLGHEGTQEVARTLVHETTHVLAYAAGGDLLVDLGDATRVFNEGLAEHMQYMAYPNPDAERQGVGSAALAWSRNHMRHAQLVSFSAFLQHHSEALVYPIGLLWVRSWVAACGPGVVAQLLRTMSRTDPPQGGSGAALWRDLSMRIGCGWGSVTAKFDEEVLRAARATPAAYGALPAVVAHVREDEDGDSFLVVEFDPPAAFAQLDPSLRVSVSLRSDSSAGPGDQYHFSQHVLPMDEGDAEVDAGVAPPGEGSDAGIAASMVGEPAQVRFFVPEHLIDGQFEYLLSIATDDTEFPLYGRWTRAVGN